MPRPDYSDIRRNFIAPTQSLDPRLRRIFALNDEMKTHSKSHSLTEISSTQKSTQDLLNISTRLDPRLKKENQMSTHEDKNIYIFDFQSIIQKSLWFKNLSSTQKIVVNQNLAELTVLLKSFHGNSNSDKMLKIPNSTLQILYNLGVFIDDMGHIQTIQLKDNLFSQKTLPNINNRMMQMELNIPPPFFGNNQTNLNQFQDEFQHRNLNKLYCDDKNNVNSSNKSHNINAPYTINDNPNRTQRGNFNWRTNVNSNHNYID